MHLCNESIANTELSEVSYCLNLKLKGDTATGSSCLNDGCTGQCCIFYDLLLKTKLNLRNDKSFSSIKQRKTISKILVTFDLIKREKVSKNHNPTDIAWTVQEIYTTKKHMLKIKSK